MIAFPECKLSHRSWPTFSYADSQIPVNWKRKNKRAQHFPKRAIVEKWTLHSWKVRKHRQLLPRWQRHPKRVLTSLSGLCSIAQDARSCPPSKLCWASWNPHLQNIPPSGDTSEGLSSYLCNTVSKCCGSSTAADSGILNKIRGRSRAWKSARNSHAVRN